MTNNSIYFVIFLPLIFVFNIDTIILNNEGETGNINLLTPVESEKIYIPSGIAIIGSTEKQLEEAEYLCDSYKGVCKRETFFNETPQRIVKVSSFYISKYEVTYKNYNICVNSGTCSPLDENYTSTVLTKEELPVVEATYDDAVKYCSWLSGRIPTEIEWEKASRGSDDRIFPWGNLFNPNLANINPSSIWLKQSRVWRYSAPPGFYQNDRSFYGVMDMAGNVAEWTSTWYDEMLYQHASSKEIVTGPSSGFLKVIRGGSWVSQPPFARITTRWPLPPGFRSIEVGFRCAWDAD